MTETQTPIVTIEAAGPPVKDPLPKGDYSGGPYKVPVVYVLADGRRVESRNRYRLLRDAKAEHALMPMPPAHPMAACFDADGKFCSTRTTFSMWGGRS